MTDYIILYYADYILVTDELSFSEAEEYCNDHYGTNLATIYDDITNDEAWNLCTCDDCRIGLNDRNVEGQYVWTDGSPFGYTKWGPHQPNNRPRKDCVRFEGNEWEASRCNGKRPFLCNHPAASPDTGN